ncbi:hypothetical protein SO802_016077 [Lithocarpus litseifolius]|uniref:Uncharacterized protein n=1 Tax=Lithocarpus litseifolius TaxID=425828 RepID=A0AAW2CZ46_9ROSI
MPPPMMASSSEKGEVVSQAAAATKLYVYLENAIGSGPLIYSLFEIALPNPLPPPPTAAPPVKVKPFPNPNPILQLKLGEYPRDMCCVMMVTLMKKLRKTAADADDDRLTKAMMMNTGKSAPVAFVVDEKIYVLGSIFTFRSGNLIKNLAEKEAIKEQALFEMYDRSDDKWTVLPNPPPIICDIENKRTEWVGHAVDLEEARKRVLLFARQGLYSCLYSFDLDGGQ